MSDTKTYVDWPKVPAGFDFVAIDEAHRDTMWEGGRPIAYQREPHINHGEWLRDWSDHEETPIYVAQEAIIGPLPAPKDSLIRRQE